MYCLVLRHGLCIRKKPRVISFNPSSVSLQITSRFSSSSTLKLTKISRTRSYDKALRILDLITPKAAVPESRGNHLRLIQNLLQTDSEQGRCIPLTKTNPIVFEEILGFAVPWSNVVGKEDAALTLPRMHGERVRADACALSYAVSSCGVARDLDFGIQFHCLALKTGLGMHVYVGSALITLYGKCGKLEDTYRMFDEMPVKNVVSWTTIISSFAQYGLIEVCLELYYQMRRSKLKPNDLTFLSLLTACTGSGSLGQGRSAHCQTIQRGFESYIHVGNALISMYCKCGNFKEAYYFFEDMLDKDLISWNSMIAGYAQHGHAEAATNLLNEMKKQKVRPDAITFLGVLSSCRHAGLVEQGRLCFNSMLEHGVKPEVDHYSCIVDLLGRAGLLEEARDLIENMPVCPNAIIWGSLLSACRLHGNVWIGIQAAESRLLLEPGCAATHVQLANLYASMGCWNQVARVRKLMKDKGLKTNPGCSWLEIRNEVHRFSAEDKSNSRVHIILEVVDSLVNHMTTLGYVPKAQEEEADA